MPITACSAHRTPHSPTAYRAVFILQGLASIPKCNWFNKSGATDPKMSNPDTLQRWAGPVRFPLFQELEIRHTEEVTNWWYKVHKEHSWCKQEHPHGQGKLKLWTQVLREGNQVQVWWEIEMEKQGRECKYERNHPSDTVLEISCMLCPYSIH